MSWSPVIRPLTRAADRSLEMRPAAGGALAGSWTSSKTGTVAPPSATVRPLKRVTIPATKAWYAGSVTLRLGWVTTIVTSSVGVLFPPAPKTVYALADSVCASFGLPFGSSALMPPIDWLRTNRPMVAMNQPAKTGQRWRALHIAIRTVAGSRDRLGDASSAIGNPSDNRLPRPGKFGRQRPVNGAAALVCVSVGTECVGRVVSVRGASSAQLMLDSWPCGLVCPIDADRWHQTERP